MRGTTAERITAAKAEAGALSMLIDSYQERLDATNEHIALLEEKDNRERLGVVCR